MDERYSTYEDFLDNDDPPDDLNISYTYLLFIQIYTLFLYHLHWLSDLEFGRKGRERRRKRKPFDEGVATKLSDYFFRRVYRMTRASFDHLHSILEPELEKIFFPGNGGKRKKKSKYHIDTKTRLSIALRYFAGADPKDIMLIHDVGYASVYYSVWGVIDAINNTERLAYRFPNHDEQRDIARGFLARSGAGFDKVIGAIDGLLICILKPSIDFCRELNCGSASFRCHRKDKYGLNLQAICDHRLKFIWIDMQWPGATSDYMAWVTSGLCYLLENNPVTKLIVDGYTFVGDNAYVKKMYMATPLKGMRTGYEDGYNFYLSQLRITIERAFGVFVHRWAILRAPLTIPLPKVAPLIESLVRLHNFCIDESDVALLPVRSKNTDNLVRTVGWSKQFGDDYELTQVGENGRPTALLGNGHHFADAPSDRRDGNLGTTPMDEMLRSVEEQGLERPQY